MYFSSKLQQSVMECQSFILYPIHLIAFEGFGKLEFEGMILKEGTS
jgi:hypothetical protein